MSQIIGKPTGSQWIMWGTVIAIGVFMALASKAHAFYAGADRSATILTHCGFIPAKYTSYTDNSLNTRIIQTKLETLGYTVGKHGIDGVYGKDTRQAISNFQQEYNLEANGIAGAHTVSLLAFATHPNDSVRRCRRPTNGSH